MVAEDNSPTLFSQRSSSTHHDVGVPVEELDAFLQTPEATLHTGQQEFGKLVLGSWKTRWLLIIVNTVCWRRDSDGVLTTAAPGQSNRSRIGVPLKMQHHRLSYVVSDLSACDPGTPEQPWWPGPEKGSESQRPESLCGTCKRRRSGWKIPAFS